MWENMNSKIKDLLEWIYCIIIALVIAILIKYYLGTPTVVQMDSMYPTLVQGDRLILNRIPRTTKKLPKRGEIITFEAPYKKTYNSNEVDLSNPIAKYNDDNFSLFKKFTYYVLELGKKSYIKRVIGLPGDHVLIENGNVYINGEKLNETYLVEGVTTERTGEFYDIVVPNNCVFAMGDHRSVSLDCRAFGCIPLDKIESTVSMRFWPLNKLSKIK